MKRALLSLLLFGLSASSVAPQTAKPAVTVTRGHDSNVRRSSLPREWITIHDSASPISLVDNIGVTIGVIFERDSVRIESYYYSAKPFTVEASEPVSAFEIRFLLFDLWGNYVRTLSMTKVEDLQGKKEVSEKWNPYSSETEALEYYASIAFVARVRTQAGRVFEANTAPALEEARKISRKFSPENLEPKPQKP